MNVLITGGASGLGKAITKRFANDSSCNVFFTYNSSKNAAEKLEKELKNTVAIKCDFRNSDEVISLRDRIEHLNIDVLINNAYTGTFIKIHFHKISHAEFLQQFAENIIPTIIITQAAINSFRKKKAGKIITVLSSALITPAPIGSSVYTANKAYLKELTKSWAHENIKFNIYSNSVSPSFMQTNFTKDTDERILEQIIENHPLKNLLTTDEVAETIFSLVDDASKINGEDILITGGKY